MSCSGPIRRLFAFMSAPFPSDYSRGGHVVIPSALSTADRPTPHSPIPDEVIAEGCEVEALSDGVLHVVPVGDLLDHNTITTDADCVCGPHIEPVVRGDGSNGWLIIHHSLDSRERK